MHGLAEFCVEIKILPHHVKNLAMYQKSMKTTFRRMMSGAALTLAAVATLLTACKKDQPDTLACNDIETTTTLTNHRTKGDGVDYSVGCKIFVRSKLIIEAGTSIEFAQGGGIIIEPGGSIEIRGTAGNRVVLRGESSARGTWAGIMIYSNDASNLIENADISGGGGEEFNSNGDLGNVIVYNDARLTVRNSSFSNSAAYGLNVLGNTDVTLSNLSFTSNATPLALPASQAHKIDAASSYTSNDNQFVEIFVADIAETVTWRSLPVPYRISPANNGMFTIVGIVDNGGLTVEAGADLQFSADCGIGVYNSAYISMEGTASQNVSLRGINSDAGSWMGVYFESNNTANSLDFVNITGAGSGAFNSNNNVASVIAFANSALSVTNCSISNGLVCGIYVGANVNFTESNNSFANLPSNTCTD